MFPTETKTLTQTPRGGGVTPPPSDNYGVGESTHKYKGETLYTISKETLLELFDYRNGQYEPKTKREIKYIPDDNKVFKILSLILAMTNGLTFALSNDLVFEKVILTLFFVIISAVLLMGLKNMTNKEIVNTINNKLELDQLWSEVEKNSAVKNAVSKYATSMLANKK